ncbi:TetR/AcrR family transcriptional regulator [Methylobacterium sp. WL30]|jgi:AcrR family transcriptional regulator|uniref:TetR/AcrR family transcriptional regulator n=1 Tax=unclassified Methylobacterium TaxID=2615210 RepID=UPI0011C7D6C7|nr:MULTISPECIES: TetR/AcrR family transcriptional regulator [unclassified Methylobacterium]MCJ2078146.1 TetR/AcrR family transcriptional regulator [Methylobacterium sp. E-016]TXM88767.1 TetR/AcrR family transcriptional regulator [Methylobacterium sp. WL116]TXN22902.1 TetR/AcrR family transcriptional regulator [Methylobacterium sp. WL93]TXN43843.1 TetR/AcrR family transcriptional regulator [Methylobacterium sp. WL119]TXN61639.1 TetR/AcrR family transcriptional regulator [Methylobacterium sp. WL
MRTGPAARAKDLPKGVAGAAGRSGATRVAKPGTRDRVLAACRDLFNERGPAAVTTAEIAAAVGINEGNLYYHFQRKEQILEALFSAFEIRLEAVATAYATQAGEARYAPYLAGWFTLMWEWRFFYRDGGTIFRLAPALRPRLKTVSDSGQDHVRQALAGMKAAGLLRAGPAETEHLIVNAWIVSTYWIDYLRSRRGLGEVRREHLDWGAAQVASLFRPYLTEAGLAAAALA